MEDLSALIFVALAVAWASYLIPKALQHHDEARRGQTVDSFSDGMRVLASREPVSARDARLVVGPSSPPRRRPAEVPPSVLRPPVEASVSAARRPAGASPSAAPRPAGASVSAARRPAGESPSTRRAARRRRRVLVALLLAVAAVAGGAAYGLVEWVYLTVPGGLVAGWLVACRLMVRREHRLTGRRGAAQRTSDSRATASPAAAVVEPVTAPGEPAPTVVSDEIAVAGNDQGFEEVSAAAVTSSVPVTAARAAGSGLWDPLPMTLPTYVTKAPAARRTVSTIDLDASGVWTSGRTEIASALARQGEAAAAAAASAADDAADDRHAVG